MIDLKTEINRLINEDYKFGSSYYQISLFANDENKVNYSITSNWDGFTDEKPRREIRVACLVKPKETIEIYKSINEPVFIINNDKDFFIFAFVIGGNAIILKEIAEKYLSHLLQPTIVVNQFASGFIVLDSIPKENLYRAANPKLRMKIFNRDKRRCRICGASPNNNEHIELHLHHIIPFEEGGLTNENNLLTLCHTCHGGLHPHKDYSLFEYLDIGFLSKSMSKNDTKYFDKIRNNISVFSLIRNEKSKKSRKKRT